MASNLQQIVRDEFPGKNVLVVGDLVADQFLQGTITRVSREAPVFILRHDQTQTVPGSAANAAANVASLGGKVSLIGVIGTDENGVALKAKLEEANVNCEHVVISSEVRTTTKVRVLAGQEHASRQQVIRIDYENNAPLSDEITKAIIANLQVAVPKADAVVISDYNYGIASREIIDAVYALAKDSGIPLIVDSRFCLGDFKNATSATPNQDEVEQIAGQRFDSVAALEEFCTGLREKMNYRSLMVTRGGNGIMLIEENAAPVHLPAIGSKDPVDVTGAGDTVIAAYSLGLASGLSFADAARIANHAGGIVVMKRGTAVAGAEELIASLDSDTQTAAANLIG